MNTTKGNTTYVALAIIAVLIIGGGAYFFAKNGDSGAAMEEHGTVMEDDGAMMEEDAVMEDEGSTMMEGDAMMETSFSGEVLAGDAAPLLDFNQADYEKALASGKAVVLYFYANWCPVCREEFPKMQRVFNELDTDEVVGFRVNYNDNETDDNEVALAREFGVAYQHTKVFLKGGERVLKAPDSWDEGRYREEIAALLAN